MVFRCILPAWAREEFPDRRYVVEGEFSDDELLEFNRQFYNIYFLPNYPSVYEKGTKVDGSMVDTFQFVFVDMDLKDGKYASKEAFIAKLKEDPRLLPTLVVDTGNGIHAYWQVSDLDAMGFLRLQRRLIRKLSTDEAVGQIYQLMRYPGTVNTKDPESFKLAHIVESAERLYTCEDLDKLLPGIAHDDEAYCQHHFKKTYRIGEKDKEIDDKIPPRFHKLMRENAEVKDIWSGKVEDRSKSDYRLGHIMHANGFKREEALSVLVNTSKALSRAPVHRRSYAENIVDKIWTFEEAADKEGLNLSSSVREILSKSGNNLKGTRFPCWRYIDATEHGFRLGQVIGLVAGAKVGKTAMALNMFQGFVKFNPDYDHFFVPLEQPANEIADRWRTMCGDEVHLHDKVQVLSNYCEDSSYRNLSLDDIREYILKYQETTKRKVGCVVIDHIGILKKKGKTGENQDLMDICHQMKAFAIETNTLLVMQSQAPREKAGVGDLELNKDAAYGTVFFESYCDYLITMWQPLKRCYSDQACPAVTAFKFCAIRHKKRHLDQIQEDVCYRLLFDSETERMRELTQDEETAFDFWNKSATNKRKRDRKTDVLEYQSIHWTKEASDESNAESDPDARSA